MYMYMYICHTSTASIKKQLNTNYHKKFAHTIVPGWLWRPGAAAAAALLNVDVGGSWGWGVASVPRSSHGQCCCSAANG